MLRFATHTGGAATVAYFGSTFFLENAPEHRFKHTNSLGDHPYAADLQFRGYKLAPHAHEAVPGLHTRHMVTTNLLAGEGRFHEAPLTFVSPDGQERQTLYHLGHDLGETSNATTTLKNLDDKRPRRVHYGAAITLFDEGLARAAFQRLPNRAGLTAKLEIKPHAEITPDSHVVLIAHAETAGSRRANASGSLYAVDGKSLGDLLVEGSVTMVEPRWASRFGGLLRALIAEH